MIIGAIHAMDEEVKMPAKDPLSNGYPTLNGHGFVFKPEDPMSIQFMQEILQHRTNNSKTNILEIGPGYGFLAEAVLRWSYQNNTCIYKGLDLDAKHLEIATKRICKNGILATSGDMQWIPEVGSFPDIEYPENSFHYIVASRVIHFYETDVFKKALCAFEKALMPKGRAYIFTAHIRAAETYGSGIYAIYKEAKRSGKEFPGYIEDLPNVIKQLAQNGLFSKQHAENPTFQKSLAEHMLFFTNKELCAAVIKYTHLNIVSSQTIHMYIDGKRKSNIGIILEKEVRVE